MTKTKHTPGPWHVGPHYKSDVESAEGRICEAVPLMSERAAANARLIAAAPDLLAALKEMAEYYGADHDMHCPGDDTCECSCKPFNDRINAAIQKAEGDS